MSSTPTYRLPGPLGMALMTDRPQFVDVYIGELEKSEEGQGPQSELLIELLRLVRDLLKDRRELRLKLDERTEELDYVLDLTHDLKRAADVLSGLQKERTRE